VANAFGFGTRYIRGKYPKLHTDVCYEILGAGYRRLEEGSETEPILLASGQIPANPSAQVGETFRREKGRNHATGYRGVADFEQTGKGEGIVHLRRNMVASLGYPWDRRTGMMSLELERIVGNIALIKKTL
jgi:hypothetical protein